jgi:hypothetical protein
MCRTAANRNIPFITAPYSVSLTHDGRYAVMYGGRIITIFDSFEHASNRAYQLNRAGLLN